MTTRSSRDRNPRGGEVAGAPMIATLRASYAAAFTRASEKSRLSSLGASQAPTGPRSLQARTSAAEGGRLRDAFGAARRRPDRCKIQDQELKTEPLPCLINSAGSSTYPTWKSVRTIRAAPRGARALRDPGDFQQRPGRAVHFRGLARSAEGHRLSHQHGRQRSLGGQRIRRAAVANGQVRGSLSARVS